MLYSASAYSVINISRSKQKNVWWHSWRDIYYIISSICFVSCFGPPFTGGVKIWWGDACSNRVCIHIFFNHETLPTRLYFVFFKISATFAFQVKCIAIIKSFLPAQKCIQFGTKNKRDAHWETQRAKPCNEPASALQANLVQPEDSAKPIRTISIGNQSLQGSDGPGCHWASKQWSNAPCSFETFSAGFAFLLLVSN